MFLSLLPVVGGDFILTTSDSFFQLSKDFITEPVSNLLISPSQLFPGRGFDFLNADTPSAKVFVNPTSWKSTNTVQFTIEYDSLEVSFKNVELDGSGVISSSANVTEIGGAGRATVQMSATGGKGFIINFKPLDGNTYSPMVLKNYSLNGVNSSVSLTVLEGSFLPQPVIVEKSSVIDVIVNAGVLGPSAQLLKGLNEKIVYQDGVVSGHTISYGGTNFNYSEIDHLISTVVRDGAFTSEFANEIAEYDTSFAGISYQVAINLVGLPNIDAVVMGVAGSDGSFVS